MHPEKKLTERESLELITQMINKAKDACHSTGLAAIMWGLIIAFCSLVRLAEIQYGFKLPFDIYLLTLVAIIPQVYLSLKEKRESKVKAYGDVFMDYLWLGFGVCIFLLIFIMQAVFAAWKPAGEEYQLLAGHPASFHFYEFSASFFLLLYGLPTFVSGISMKFRPMIWGGLWCWVSCLAAIYTPVKADLLLTALSSIFAWFIPGMIMEKEYQKAKKELAAQHV